MEDDKEVRDKPPAQVVSPVPIESGEAFMDKIKPQQVTKS